MNAAHWHLILVHIPIVISPLASVLLSLGLVRGEETLRRLSLVLLIICGLTAGAAFWTGDGAEQVVEHVAGVSEVLIEAHEEAAEVVVWLCAISGIVSALALLPALRALAQKLTIAVMLVSWAASAGLAYTGYLGGKTRHPEAYVMTVVQPEGTRNDD